MSIKTSENNAPILKRLTEKFRFPHNNITGRIAIAYSLQCNKKFLDNDVKYNNKGFEYQEETLFGSINGKSNQVVYKSLIDQYYEKIHTDDEFRKLVKLHLDDGLERLGKEILDKYKGKNIHIDYLINIIQNGLDFVGVGQAPFTSTSKTILPAFEDLLEFSIGQRPDGSEIKVRLNDLNEFDSHHIAIAGMTGTGKTELIKDILYQISVNSNNEIKFIYLDYKGEGNSNKLRSFLEYTDSNYINPLEDEFDFNPLQYINLSNEKTKNFNINNFVDSISYFEPKIGPKQKYNFKSVLKQCVDSSAGIIPTMKDIHCELIQYYDENDLSPDTLLATIEDLANGIFTSESQSGKSLYDENIYLSLHQSLSDTIRQTTVFLILNYILAVFTEFNDVSPNSDRINPLRYIIVIDEAHIYLKNKNARKILEQLLRVIRSKGVVVVMLSQGPEDYRQSDFDFASQVKIPICLNVNNKAPKIIQRFIGWNKSEGKLKNEIDKLENGMALINIDGIETIKICQFWRTLQSK
ncbi:MAG: DUF1832 domain-containing protein [Candidatus Lokiarchaeota archaeon]|nr:DUF1832 domain-containing protein [Candidatus Lokiarchaeota archaeon]